MSDELRDLAALVAGMREAQREFFDPKRRRPSTIGEAKRLEREVDRRVDAILVAPALPRQGGLFDG